MFTLIFPTCVNEAVRPVFVILFYGTASNPDADLKKCFIGSFINSSLVLSARGVPFKKYYIITGR